MVQHQDLSRCRAGSLSADTCHVPRNAEVIGFAKCELGWLASKVKGIKMFHAWKVVFHRVCVLVWKNSAHHLRVSALGARESESESESKSESKSESESESTESVGEGESLEFRV